MSDKIQSLIAETFLQMADGLETGSFGKKIRIAVTGLGSEHGEENVMQGAVLASGVGIDVYYIGTLEREGVRTVYIEEEEDGHKKMQTMVESGEVDGAVTMHFPFPIGVSTVGKVTTPARGKEMYIAATTGTSRTDRAEAMEKNAIYGISAAKAEGISQPAIGILNLDGARQAESVLKQLKENGYDITFAESARLDGGIVMRGNDVLQGVPDVMVCDSLTGNILMKMLSSYQTGGDYEASGYGYGPGLGDGYENLILIISRASGAPVIAGAIRYAASLAKGRAAEKVAAEFKDAREAGLDRILSQRRQNSENSAAVSEAVPAPPKEVVTAQISGVEIMELEEAVQELWKAGIYAESGMGCTGPIILVKDGNEGKVMSVLAEKKYI